MGLRPSTTGQMPQMIEEEEKKKKKKPKEKTKTMFTDPLGTTQSGVYKKKLGN